MSNKNLNSKRNHIKKALNSCTDYKIICLADGLNFFKGEIDKTPVLLHEISMYDFLNELIKQMELREDNVPGILTRFKNLINEDITIL